MACSDIWMIMHKSPILCFINLVIVETYLVNLCWICVNKLFHETHKTALTIYKSAYDNKKWFKTATYR
jgi:hypothetical protein